MTSHMFAPIDADDLSLPQLLALDAADLQLLTSFDAGMTRVISTEPVGSQRLSRWWHERERRIASERAEIARAERDLERWLLGDDDAALELVPAHDERVITLPSFFWALAIDNAHEPARPLETLAIRSAGDDDVEVCVTAEDMRALRGAFEALADDVLDGVFVDDLDGEAAWCAEHERQRRWMESVARVLFDH